MKRLLLAAAALSFAATIGTAFAGPDVSNDVQFWNLASVPSGDANSLALVQQALPGAAQAILNDHGTAFGPNTPAYQQPINYNLNPGGDVSATIAAFFNSDQTGSKALPANCPAVGCGDQTATAAGFTSVTLFEFTFSTTGEIFTVSHDDGVSLFASGTENGCTQTSPGGAYSGCGNDLLNIADSAPTSDVTSGPVTLAAGTYDLWYTAANGTPEVLVTNTVPVPAPLIGHGLPVLLAVGGLLFGAKMWDRSNRQRSAAARPDDAFGVSAGNSAPAY